MSAIPALVNKQIRQMRNTRLLLMKQSAFKVLFIIVFAFIFEIGLCMLFLDAFRFIDSLGGIGVMIISRLFSLFFLGMGIMLVASGIITSYSTVFRSDEIPFLLVRPFTAGQIAVYKFVESTILSSWAFFFIIVPFVWSYAWHERLSPMFAVWIFVFALPFLVICSGLGTLMTMVFVRWMPPVRYLKIPALLLFLGIATVLWQHRHPLYNQAGDARLAMAALAPGFTLSTNPALPSWWLSEGVLNLTNHQWLRGGLFLNVMISTCIFMFLIVAFTGKQVFYKAWLKTAEGNNRQRRAPVLLRAFDRPWRFLDDQARAMVLKDLRTFLRDPMQWSQVLIFFGLLAIYFVNIRQFRYNLLPDVWRNVISFLNIFSVSAVMCSLGSRFIYPQLSLEGHAFWIIGLSPIKMTRVLMTKFTVSLIGMVSVSSILVFTSSVMLEASPRMLAVSMAIAIAVSAAISALSTGLGAAFLDLNERNPAAIVSGFGGTLNLVICLAFMIAAILPFGLIFHFMAADQVGASLFNTALTAACIWLLFITVLATYLPLKLGSRALLRTEF